MIFSEKYDEKTLAEIRRERDKKRYAAMSVSDKQAKIIKNLVRRTIDRVNKEEKIQRNVAQSLVTNMPC